MGQRRGEKKKHLGQGGCSSAKRAERAHPQLVHWWLLVHSSPAIAPSGTLGSQKVLGSNSVVCW